LGVIDKPNTGCEKINCTTLIKIQYGIINYLLYGTNNKILYVNIIYFFKSQSNSSFNWDVFSDQDRGSGLIKSDDGCLCCCCLQFALNFKVWPRYSLHTPLRFHTLRHFRITFHHTVSQQLLQFCNFCHSFDVENSLCSGVLILTVFLTNDLSSFSSVQTFFPP